MASHAWGGGRAASAHDGVQLTLYGREALASDRRERAVGVRLDEGQVACARALVVAEREAGLCTLEEHGLDRSLTLACGQDEQGERKRKTSGALTLLT